MINIIKNIFYVIKLFFLAFASFAWIGTMGASALLTLILFIALIAIFSDNFFIGYYTALITLHTLLVAGLIHLMVEKHQEFKENF